MLRLWVLWVSYRAAEQVCQVAGAGEGGVFETSHPRMSQVIGWPRTGGG